MQLKAVLSKKGGLKALVLFLFVLNFSPSRAQTDSLPLLSYSEPKTYIIGDITISGVKFLDPTAMIAVTGLKPGDKIIIPGEQTATAVKKLWKQGILGNVEVTISKIEGNKVFLNFHLEERRRLSKFVFIGTKKSETEDLREKIRLIKGKVVTDALIKNSRQTILKHFHEKGFLNTKVKVARDVDTTMANSVILTFEIKKGKKVKVEQLRIENNIAFTDARLRRKMKKTKQRNPAKFWTSSKFIAKEFKADKEKIIDFYNTKGYRDMEIVHDTVYPYFEKRINGKKVSRFKTFYTPAQADSVKAVEEASKEELKALKLTLDSLEKEQKLARRNLPRKIIRDTLTGDTTIPYYKKVSDRVKVAKANVEYVQTKIKNIKKTPYVVVHEGDKIDSTEVKHRVTVKITVDEGRRFYFRSIQWKGNYLYDDKYLANILGIKAGDIYDKELLERRLNYNPSGADISSLYLDDGYLFFSVEPVEVRVEGDSIDIEMRIYEGPQATINNVIVTGNTKTHDHVIYRELRTLPGDKFNRSLLIRSQRELSVLQYFDPEKIGINPIPDPAKGTVDIKYDVTEKPSDQIQLSGGYAAYLGFVGTLGLQFNNFSLRNIANFSEYKPLPGGDGQRLSLSLQANGRQYQNYSVSFTEPWLGGKRPNSLTVGVSRAVSRSLVNNSFNRRSNNFASLAQNTSGGKLIITTASVSLGRRLRWPDDFFTLSHTFSFQNLDLYELTSFAVSKTESLDKGSFNNMSITNTLARNSIDNPTYPRGGSSLSLAISTTPPYSLFESKEKIQNKSLEERYKWVEYHKWMFDGSFFTKIAGNLVLNTRMHYGFLGSYNPTVGLTPFERFRLGGSGLTGFNFFLGYDLIGLRGYGDAAVKNDPTETAGVVYNKHVLELRYPITLNPAASIFVLTFAEAGNNWSQYSRFNPFTQYKSVGVGARIFMPAFGLLGIDYGYGLDEIPGFPEASRNRFTFSIGQQLR